MRIKIKSIKLTTIGRNKLRKIEKRVKDVATKQLNYYMKQTVKPSIIAASPTSIEERDILSKDTSGVGTYSNGRFLKLGGQRYLRTALSMEPVKLRKSPNSVWADYGRGPLINKRIGFSWRVDIGGVNQIRSTDDKGAHHATWANLLWLWEKGASYTVTSRGMYPLNPEPGVKTATMMKVIPKKAMVAKGYFGNRSILQDKIGKDIRQSVRLIK